MREIKFRVWDKWKKKWVYPVQDVTNNFHYRNNNNLFYQQFTGLEDKNGKEIYEGDVVHLKTSKKKGYSTEGDNIFYTIKFGAHNTTDNVLHGAQGFYAFRNEKETSLSYVIDSLKGCVIGNIYENPELLEEK